jgi:hypothetical protein
MMFLKGGASSGQVSTNFASDLDENETVRVDEFFKGAKNLEAKLAS